MPAKVERKGNVKFFVGAPKQGKTTAINALLYDSKTRPERYAVMDPFAADHDGIRANTLADNLETALRYMNGQRDDNEWSVTIVPQEGQESETAKHLATAVMLRKATLIVDEANEACSHEDVAPEVKRIAKRGRHFDSALWLATQRPADVARHLTSGAERYVFWLDEANDLRYIAGTMGREAASIVSNLEPSEFLYSYGKEMRRGRAIWVRGRPVIEMGDPLDIERF